MAAQNAAMIKKTWARVTTRIWGRFATRQKSKFIRSRDLWLLALWIFSACPAHFSARAQESSKRKPSGEHVVLVIWDGMRPEFVTPEVTPTLHRLAERGVVFARHHSVYVTSTEVNGTALATGSWPERSGIIANREYRPEIDLMRTIATESVPHMRIGDVITGGKYIAVPTIAELVQSAGFSTAVAGTKPVATVQDRSTRRQSAAARNSRVVYSGMTLPSDAISEVEAALGVFPDPPDEAFEPYTAQNEWTTRALTEVLWKREIPKFSVLWLSDPDYTQHQTGPGSPAALAAMRDSDNNLARLLEVLETRGVLAKTNIFLTSDHGFSTVDRLVDVAGEMRAAGFDVVRDGFRHTPRKGQILLNSLGGSVFLYVIDQDRKVIRDAVEFLQRSEFSGPIFTRDGLPGTFRLSDIHIASPAAPDIVFSFRWKATANRFGTPGTFISDGAGRRRGYGMHASLSTFDVHNTLVASGPDIRRGVNSDLPSASIDVAPTILQLLGIPHPGRMDGRVLEEALEGSSPPLTPDTRLMEATCDLPDRKWRQYLKITRLGEHVYFDEGNASALE
jgi:arylsulfatase A-like enzyme